MGIITCAALSDITGICYIADMPRFIFDMPDDMAALVEAFRIRRGHKATAVAVRELISTGLEVAEELKDCVFDRETGRFVVKEPKP